MIGTLTENNIKDLEEFDDHPVVTYFQDKKTGLEGFISIHRSNPKVPSFGATRLWNYTSEVEAIKDSLRLSKMMSYKAALAGLNCGGAKAVIMDRGHTMNENHRSRLFHSYSERVNFLGGKFITGTDVGVFQSDLTSMKEHSSYIVGFNDNTTEFTALGVFESIKVCLKEIFGSELLEGRSFAIQGLGKVGSELLGLIYKEVGESGKIYVSEINLNTLKLVKQKYPQIISVTPDEIHKQNVDVFCPCALSNSLNAQTISNLKAKIIVGSANNQLANEEIGILLYKLGILYAPDYVVNAGGLIAVFDEYNHKEYDFNRVAKLVQKIPHTLEGILNHSKNQNKGTNIIANQLAEDIFNSYA